MSPPSSVRTTGASSASRAAGLSIRRAGREDLPGVAALWLALCEHHARREPRFALRRGGEQEVRRLLEAQLRDPAVACFVWGEAAALEGLCIVRVERAPAILAEPGRAEITDLYVIPARRRQGLARELLARALDWARARGIEQVEVRVASANPEGQAFWRASGFGDFMDVLHRRL